MLIACPMKIGTNKMNQQNLEAFGIIIHNGKHAYKSKLNKRS